MRIQGEFATRIVGYASNNSESCLSEASDMIPELVASVDTIQVTRGRHRSSSAERSRLSEPSDPIPEFVAGVGEVQVFRGRHRSSSAERSQGDAERSGLRIYVRSASVPKGIAMKEATSGVVHTEVDLVASKGQELFMGSRRIAASSDGAKSVETDAVIKGTDSGSCGSTSIINFHAED